MTRSLDSLARLFAGCGVYPRDRFTANTPICRFQELYPAASYSVDVERLISQQPERSDRRGSDLPWWGDSYFSSFPGERTVIIAQDSLAKDAGSTVFWAFLFGHCGTEAAYRHYANTLENPRLFRYGSWRKIHTLLRDNWHINLDCTYITDARKVYRPGPREKARFDARASRLLLNGELEVTKPDRVVILGNAGVTLLLPGSKYAELVRGTATKTLAGVPVIVAPFPVGQGPTQPDFEKLLRKATDRILQE